MSALNVLQKAKTKLIESGVNRDGWLINRETGCSFCALGSLQFAAGGTVYQRPDGKWDIAAQRSEEEDVFDSDGYSSAWDALDKVATQEGIENIALFNDSTDSDEEVIALFDKAIELVQ